MEQQQPDEKFMRLALNEAEKALEEQEVPIGAVVVADGRIVGRGHNLVETWRTLRLMRKCRPDSRSLDRRRQILVRMYVVCDGRALHHVCGGDCVEPGRAGGLWRRRSEAWLSPLFGAGVSAPNDGDAGGIGRGVREARPFVLRCVEKVIFGKCRKKTKFAFPAFRQEFRRMVATYRTGRYFRWVCREW